MPRLDHDSTDIRQQLEFCLTKGPDGRQVPVAKSSSVPLNNWSSFAAGAGLSALILAGAPLIYFAGSIFGLPQGPARNAVPVSVASTVVPVPITVPISPINFPNPVGTRVPMVKDVAVPVTPMIRHQFLSASKSAITGIVDPKTMTASYYWTILLHNSSSSGQEAQMEIKLPAGGVVSRATLWVNGRAEEAAFNATEQVQAAYSWIVDNNRRRDPLLITQVAPDRVLIKASPVQRGRDMKLRIGMTIPMKLNEQGEASLTMPQVLAANFALDCRQDVHLTSSNPLYANQVNMRDSEGRDFVLRGNLKATELRDLTVATPGQSRVVQVATRATHSNPPAFIVATVNTEPGADYGKVQYTKTFTEPNCPIVSSTDAAYRVSYLWAHQEIEKLAPNDWSQAVDLASIYREVSSVSGAVVLERQSDYTFNGLDRNMYRSTAYAETKRVSAPKAMPMQSAMTRRAQATAEFTDLAVDKSDSYAQTMDAQSAPIAVHAAAAPILQGATNGTIGPQGIDATMVTGVNTAGTTPVNNLTKIEAILNLASNLVEAILLIFGIVLVYTSLVAKVAKRDKTVKCLMKALFGASVLTLGLNLPWMINGIVAFIRDMNILS